MWIPAALKPLPLPMICGLFGALCLGIVGALAGLVIGLNVYVPTAWAAMIEVGIPATLVGFVLGLLVGAIALLTHRRRSARGR